MTDLNPVDAMTTDYRALCAELVAAWDALPWEYDWLGNAIGAHGDLCDDSAVDRARALLDQPVAEGPTDKELWVAGSDDFRANCYPSDAIAYARAVLARWGRPTPQPVAVSERLPEPGDLAPWPDEPNASHWCWFGSEMDGGSVWEQRSAAFSASPSAGGFTHWLPANALPIPRAGGPR